MNYNPATSWLLKDIPAADTLWHDSELELEGHPRMNLADLMDAFQLTLPLLLTYNAPTVIRNFPGGTVLSLLQFIYAFYQELMSVEYLAEMQRNVVGANVNRLAGLRERLEAGEFVRRLDVIGRGCNFEGIRNNVLLLD